MTEAYSVAVRQLLRVESSESCKVMLTDVIYKHAWSNGIVPFESAEEPPS